MLHPWKINCPNCKRNATVNDLKFSAKGEIHMDLICITCGIGLIYDTTWENIIISCSQWDNQKPILLTEVSATLQ